MQALACTGVNFFGFRTKSAVTVWFVFVLVIDKEGLSSETSDKAVNFLQLAIEVLLSKGLHAVPHRKVRNSPSMPHYIVEQEDRTDGKMPPH